MMLFSESWIKYAEKERITKEQLSGRKCLVLSQADRCPLEHHDGCEGGIREGFDNQNQKWRACPRGYVCIDDDLSDELDDHGSNGFMEDDILGEQCMLTNVPSMDLSLKGAAALSTWVF